MTSRRTYTRIAIIGLIFGLMIAFHSMMLTAQENSEFCVQAFEDRNGNGVQDTGEPFITRGISAQLSNADGIITQTALIDTSPTAGRGLICFVSPPAQYTLTITSADFVATTATNMTVTLSAGQNLLLEYGGQRMQANPIASTQSDMADAESEDQRIERAVVAGVGASVTMCLTLFIGFVLYMIFLRGRGRQQQQAYGYYPDTGQFRPPTGTGQMPPVPHDTGQFHPPPTDTGTYQQTDSSSFRPPTEPRPPQE